jgi:hypothetical protein
MCWSRDACRHVNSPVPQVNFVTHVLLSSRERSRRGHFTGQRGLSCVTVFHTEKQGALSRTEDEDIDSSDAICRLCSWIMTIIHEILRNMLAYSMIGPPRPSRDVSTAHQPDSGHHGETVLLLVVGRRSARGPRRRAQRDRRPYDRARAQHRGRRERRQASLVLLIVAAGGPSSERPGSRRPPTTLTKPPWGTPVVRWATRPPTHTPLRFPPWRLRPRPPALC